MKFGTNLTKKEILALENAGFHLPQRAVISPRRLFGGDILVDPKARSGKNIRRNKKAPTTKHANNCASDYNDSSSWIQMHYYFGFGNPAQHSIVHDHHWNFPKLFMFILQRNGDKGLRQARPMGKLQVLVFHLHSHM
jgi:hypothetical protein